MKKIFLIGALVASGFFCQNANAQSLLQNLLSGSSISNTSKQSTSDTKQNVGNLIGNLISSVTGDLTTTQANLIGEWSYTDPSVQFESENMLTQAGGSAIATKCETKLAQYYKVVGIKPGAVVFTFAEDGTCTYAVGSRKSQGTYVFNKVDKTVSITTSTGQTVKTYVTISGSKMALCFDGTKLLSLFNSISSKFQALSKVSALASNYNGMKVGFKFERK